MPESWIVRECSLPMGKKKDWLDAGLWTGTIAHTGFQSYALNIHVLNNRRRFRAARAAVHAGFVPLVPRSAPGSCRSCRFPHRLRAVCAARAAFRVGFAPRVPLFKHVSCRA